MTDPYAEDALDLQAFQAMKTAIAGAKQFIVDAIAYAENDKTAADNMLASAATLKTQVLATKTSVDAFTPAASYSAAQLTQIRNVISGMLTTQATIIDAVTSILSHRKAVDTYTVKNSEAVLFLARNALGERE